MEHKTENVPFCWIVTNGNISGLAQCTKTGEIFENSKTLKYWKDFLKNKYFCQVHKSYIVSMRYISALKEKEVELSNIKIKIPLSRRRKNECKDALFQYIREKIR